MLFVEVEEDGSGFEENYSVVCVCLCVVDKARHLPKRVWGGAGLSYRERDGGFVHEPIHQR